MACKKLLYQLSASKATLEYKVNIETSIKLKWLSTGET